MTTIPATGGATAGADSSNSAARNKSTLDYLDQKSQENTTKLRKAESEEPVGLKLADHVLVNDSLDETVDDLLRIIDRARRRYAAEERRSDVRDSLCDQLHVRPMAGADHAVGHHRGQQRLDAIHGEQMAGTGRSPRRWVIRRHQEFRT